MKMREVINAVQAMMLWEAAEDTSDFASADGLVAWGDSIGVYATVFERTDSIELDRIDRDPGAQPGTGAIFLQALCAYADRRHKPIYGTVTGGNSALEDYYSQFGFQPQEDTRDDETSDVVIVREPR